MRKEYIDWLRNISILFLFPYHTARVFDSLNPFYVKGITNSFSDNLIHASFWFMPLLFLLAGMSSFYALQRRPARLYFKERFFRLLLPLIFGCLVIVPPQKYYARLFHFNYQGNYLDFLKSYFTDFSNWSEYGGGISPAHLWFILFLFLISVSLLPLMLQIIKTRYSPAWLGHPWLALLPFAGLALLSALPDTSGKNIFVYGGYFMLGFAMATNDGIIGMVEKYRQRFLAAALLGTTGIFVAVYTAGDQPGLLFTAFRFLVYWVTLLAILGYGKRYLDRSSKWITYFNPAAFPVYILHQTYLVIVGYYILKVVNQGIIPFLLILLLSFCVSMATYEMIRRFRPLRIWFGLKG